MAAMDASVFILAGGQSTRMGTDKALLLLDGISLLERAIELARQVTSKVFILGPREKYGSMGVDTVQDEFAGCGPLAGIHAALGISETDLNLIISVDTPFMTSQFLQYLLDRASAQPDALAVVPDAAGGLQGTCAVYRRPFRAVAGQQLKRGRNKVADVYPLVRMEYVDEQEIHAAGFDPAIFANLNTPEEFARVQREGTSR